MDDYFTDDPYIDGDKESKKDNPKPQKKYDEVIRDFKKFELILINHNYYYYQYVTAIKLVKDFIKSRKRILYGGTAIDFALRAKGSNLYPDEEAFTFPDLDFYSPDNVKDAYELGQIFHTNGLGDVSVIVAYHIQTMRVRFNMTATADISYVPKNIYETLPTIEFDGFRVIHPHFQMMSMHIGMSFPFINAPREVILDRKNKDFVRYDMLLEHYPIERPAIKLLSEINANLKINHHAVYSGLIAYCAMCDLVRKIPSKTRPECLGTIKSATSADNLEISFKWPANAQQNPVYSAIVAEAPPPGKPYRTSYIDYFPDSTVDGDVQYFHYVDERIHVTRFDSILITSIPYAMALMLLYYYTTGEDAYMLYYHSFVEINTFALKHLPITDPSDEELRNLSPFLIPMSVWPSEDTPSISNSLKINLDITKNILNKEQNLTTIKPRPYYPANGGDMPEFNYEGSPYFRIGYVNSSV